MKTLAALGLLLFTLAPAQTAGDLTGKWTGTFSPQAEDGTTRDQPIQMDLTQKGKELTGTAGPNADQQWPISKGAVSGAKVTFDVTTDNGLVISFALTSADGRLKGEANASRDGEKRLAKIDVGREKK